MPRHLKYLLTAILFLSGLITALSSALIPVGSAPDEIQHYSYVQYVANNPLDFPPHFEDILTGHGKPNHLIHPPLYYQIMAIPYSLMSPESQLTAVGRSIDDAGGTLTREAVIPPLRSASLSIFIVHLIGIYCLINYLISTNLVKPWLGLLAAACLTHVPAVTVIGGTLNNDVLVLAIWPYLATNSLKFWHLPTSSRLYLLSILVSASILTKATLWFAAAAVVAVVFLSMRRDWIHRATFGSVGFLRHFWNVSKPSTRLGVTGATLSILASTAALASLVTRLTRYGELQPGYATVFGLSPNESKFFAGGPPEVPLGPLEFSSWGMSLTLRSLYGVLTHDDRIYVQNPDRFFQVVVAISTIALVFAAWRLMQDPSDRAVRIALAFMSFALLFTLVFLIRAYGGYHENGRFAAQGRYFFVCYGGWVIAVSIVLSRRPKVRKPSKIWVSGFATILYSFCIVSLIFLFVRPLFYLNNTTQIHRAAGVSSTVDDVAKQLGFKRVELQALAPQSLIDKGRKNDRMLPSPRWIVAWSDSKFIGDVTADECIEVWIYALGNVVWREPARLSASLESGDEEVIDIASNPEVHEVVLQGTGDLLLEHVNFESDGPQFSERVWPENRIVDLLDVYSRPC